MLGFVIGFGSFILLECCFETWKPLMENRDHSISDTKNSLSDSKNIQNFKSWRLTQGVQVTGLDFDSFCYAKKKDHSKRVLLESEWLKKRISIVCVVFVEKLQLAMTIKDTWGKSCNSIFFFSRNFSDLVVPVIHLKIKFSSSWQYLCEVINYVWNKRKETALDWIIFIKDDLIVIPENLRYILSTLNSNEAYYLGHPVILWGQSYNIAQAGYVLSFEATRKLMDKFNTSSKCLNGGKYWKKEDYDLGKNLASLGIQPSDTRDSFGLGTFNGFTLVALLWKIAKSSDYWTRALYPPKLMCCSNRMVTFSINESSKMRTIHYLLYNVRIFDRGTHGNEAAPTPIPENQVWKVALKEEFNMTEVKEMSNDEYFRIWQSKYSEPHRFNSKIGMTDST